MADLNAMPEGCVANVISLTTPWDACRLSMVSSIFRSAAESDEVWKRFLPPDCASIISQSSDSSLLECSPSKKQLFLSLCDNPILIDAGKKSFSLDKRSGKKCCMLSARDLMIVWGDTPIYWRWTSEPCSRFEEVAELINVCWLEIRGKINTSILSPTTLYAAFLVFKSNAGAHGFNFQPVEVTVGVVGSESSKQNVYLDVEIGQRQQYQIAPRRAWFFNRRRLELRTSVATREDHAHFPRERGDGWLEIELGKFFNKGGEDGEVEMSVLEVEGGHWKGGLIVQGIEIRPERS